MPTNPSVRPEPVEGLTARSPLAALNAHITQASQTAAGVPGPTPNQWPDLRSARRFRETWERLSAETAVVQATQRAPDNAGPLNSHRLVLHTLGLMAELSPHYLRRFLAHTENLLWLEQAQTQLKAPVAKTAKPARTPTAAQPGRAVKVVQKKK